MKFSYIHYEIEPSAMLPSGEVHRPMVPLRIVGPKSAVRLFGLLDTGADHVFVSAALAEVLGIEMRVDAGTAWGAGGHALDVRPGLVELEIAHGAETYRWPVEVGFLAGDDDPPIAYLGHAGFLEFFSAHFDTESWQVELKPNNRLVSLAHR